MATNDILKFAGSAVSMLDDAAYALLNEGGHEIGVANPELANKALLQSSLLAAGLAEYIADNQVVDIDDSLTPAEIAVYLFNAVVATIPDVPDASTIEKGKIEISTSAEAQALASTLVAITPSTLNAGQKGANQDLLQLGRQVLFGGLILQWGLSAAITTGTPISFKAPFPNAVFGVLPVDYQGSIIQEPKAFAANQPTVNGFTLVASVDTDVAFWVALGF